MKSFSQYLTELTAPINVEAINAQFQKALAKFGSKEGTPKEIAKAINKLGPKYLFDVSTRTAPALAAGDISVWGFYEPIADQDYVEDDGGDFPIELIVLFSPKDKTLGLTPEGLRWFARALSDTLAHEWIHLKQARARKWQNVKTKKGYLYKVENIEVGSYLANDDEIEAHALSIALSLKDHFKSKTGSIRFLKRPTVGVVPDHHFDMYIKVFGHGHPVVKRLFKKIVGFLDSGKL